MNSNFLSRLELLLQTEYYTSFKHATATQLHDALSKTVLAEIHERWEKSREAHTAQKRACYFSAEFLMGRAVYNNLYCLGILDEVKAALEERGIDLAMLEDIEDDALGNGGLGRLAACFLDSAATLSLPLDGYGIRYQYGLFKQYFENGFQKELPDDWQRFGDPWSIRRDELAVTVSFHKETVRAVPYDMPVIGYGTRHISTLRLWQSEAVIGFDLNLFNQQKYDKAVKAQNDAENISKVLYPNDDTDAGKKLRLKQQYFFCSASLQDIIRTYKKTHSDFSAFSALHAIQLNDTHPVVSIPELMRILIDEEGLSFEEAFSIAQQTFSYTNHTVMAEALEKWGVRLFRSVLPRIYQIIKQLDAHLIQDLTGRGIAKEALPKYRILENNQRIHMARMAIYGSSATNGVARIHTEILKQTALPEWYALYPNRFQNKTNGITQRRWFGLCNPELADYISTLVGRGWTTDLTVLKGLEQYQQDETVLRQFATIKYQNKERLAAYLLEREGVTVSPDWIFDVQVKRLHEYKRQLLNAFSILDLYFGIKEGRVRNFHPTVFLFGAKAAPGYFRAKAIIKFINEIARLVQADPVTRELLQIVFVQNYCVSYAEKMIPAADVSEQISTAGTEASGTGNMKLMLNGAVTLGTLDGANVEIVEQAGTENNYIFGAKVSEIEAYQESESYDPTVFYQTQPRIRRVVDTLIDGTLDDNGSGMFRELYDALLKGASWHAPDHYFLLLDFLPYAEAKLNVNADYADTLSFSRKCLLNVASSGMFSSDRTVRQYAEEIWGIRPVSIE